MAGERPDADDTFVRTRKTLHGVAESLIAGPQYRESGTIRLSVSADGFTGAVLPVAVLGTDLVWPQGRAALAGTVRALAVAAGLDAGPPVGAYDSAEPLNLDDVLDIDAGAAALVYRSLHIGAQALKRVASEQDPVLWPEHFDIAIAVGEVNYGVSPGDSYHRRPYAYVGPFAPRVGDFWNAPFGALRPVTPDDDAAGVATFFEQGRRQAALDPLR